ncbi:diguanylate cyclase (GGDEF)-like protein [Kineococcus radiotolerans]|uniref:Diguanylate cyclase (GGDEF)-like protein n=1 Tax=Kineococcus radiotolerans TaxID=131568 RepID=A0A7W4TM77_KINRA|nr:EAL domain-containing protein [Kineococcus radiotolerans]MBB2900851.1 diguanylate cyclase (GGDEF)-like protein [Kineococcus radiotolerans]
MTPSRRGRPLQSTLLALVLVPVVGLTAVAGVAVDDRLDRARDAEAALAEVRAAIALDEVRDAVAQEVVPVLAAAALARPRGPAASGATPEQVERALGATAARAASTAATDLAVAAASPVDGEGARTAARALAGARTAPDPGTGFGRYDALLHDLGGHVGDHLRAARTLGLEGELSAALNDLQRVSRAHALAGKEVAFHLAVAAGAGAVDREDFLRVWGAYHQAAADVRDADDDPAVARAWEDADRSAAALRVDGVLAAAARSDGEPALGDVVVLATSVPERNAAQRAVLARAAGAVVERAQRQADEARRQLQQLLVLCGVVVAATLTGTLLARRAIARPLGRLAEQSRAVAAGELVDVEENGPAEVRVVAQGLAAAVDSLRRVQAQADAIAAGDLDCEVVRTPVPGPLGAFVHASVTQVITAFHERERLQADLAHQAAHDALTELPNRAQTLVLTERALHRAARQHGRVGLLFVDLDHFKAVNDSFGHAAGDELLRVVASRMHETVRGGDVVCRLGGDEFVVLVEGVEDEKGLVDLGERLIRAVSAPVALTGLPQAQHVRVGASVGVAVGTPGALDAERLVRDADAAVYRAKSAGRGVVEVFDDELRAELSARAELETALRRGLDGGELVLHYQPVLDLQTGRTRSVEALVRWQRPGHGLVPPDSFIPVAEASSLVCDLGRWALAEATAQLVRWDVEGGHRAGLDVAVNISGRHLAQAHLLDDVTDALTASGIAASRLTVEITETVLVDEPLALEHLRSLREIGVRVAIDDFGTGYTSIGQLSRLPVDVLKIDRSFVSSPEAGNGDLVRLLISAAHSFSLGVVAEGVEEDTQLSALLAASCDAAQGFLFARPVPADDLPAAAFAVDGAGRGARS